MPHNHSDSRVCGPFERRAPLPPRTCNHGMGGLALDFPQWRRGWGAKGTVIQVRKTSPGTFEKTFFTWFRVCAWQQRAPKLRTA
jgi:hypothetical protein